MNSNNRKLIPIIGTISAGKSTFLNGLLGTNILQKGSSTTTKFVCLIKHSANIQFYKVKVSRVNNQLNFEKESEVINDEGEIKEIIMGLNASLINLSNSNSDEQKANIFYMLEIPIKNIDNNQLLDECYFMDIPGLNEINNRYIETIFSLITPDDIKFEIMIFDCKSMGGNDVLHIFQNLNKKNCLLKSGNLFILNKIDANTEGGENDVVRTFNQYFYDFFGKNNSQNSSSDNAISIYQFDNCWVPMNSISFLAEVNMENDFASYLKYAYFNFLKSKEDSFKKYITYKINFVKNIEEIKKDLNSVSDEEMKVIIEATNNINDISNESKKSNDLTLEDEDYQDYDEVERKRRIEERKESENLLKSLFLIYKKRINKLFSHSESYNILKEFFHNPKYFSNKTEKNICIKKNQIEGSVIYKLDKCLQTTLDLIDRENELKNFRMQLTALKEYVINRKLRIVFIGNISVGKSSIINTIIGKEIIPTKEGECTYRGVIIRHEDSDEYKLYSTELIEKGEGLGRFSYFDCGKFICKGIKNIKEQLKNKNNDKNNINQNDAFFLLTGKLKIFEYINIGNIIEEIEFVDLPGANNEENDFNKKKYNTNVLTFSNCCIYVNVSSSVEDETSVIKINEQFKSDKDKVFLTLRPKFIKTCLFIINKSDEIEQENGKIKPSEIEKKSDELYNAIFDNNSNEILKKDDLNISFVSSKYFMEYLNVKEKYVYLLESDPHELITELNNDYISQTPSESFLDFIRNEIRKIEKNFNLTKECGLIKKENLPEEFELNLKNILNVFGIDSNSLVISFYKLKEA